MITPKTKLIEACANLKAPVICEVGSRDAADGLELLRALQGSHLHLFEANPDTVPICEEAIWNSGLGEKVTLTPQAVSDSVGTVKFYPVDPERSEQKDQGFSSMFQVSGEYTKRRKSIVQKEIEVESTTLDRYFQEKPKPEVLWIDVEGAELLVLNGAEEVLKSVRVLQLEVGFRAMHQGRPLFWELDKWLGKRGFQLLGFAEMGAFKSFLVRHKLLPNLPWKSDAIYIST